MQITAIIDSVQKEIAEIEDIHDKPHGAFKKFGATTRPAVSLVIKEKEILVFAAIQWIVITAAIWLFFAGLTWMTEWGLSGPIAIFVWSILCIGIAAYPIGMLTGCMGAAHFLRRQKGESTVAGCLRLVFPKSWSLWAIHWVDGVITVKQILARIPKKKGTVAPAERAARELLYYAWKLGIAGVLPSILAGHGLQDAVKHSIAFVKDNFREVAILRAGYSASCWVIGIGVYIFYWGILYVPQVIDAVPLPASFSEFPLLGLASPFLFAVGVVMVVLRPVYVLALCDLYSDHVERTQKAALAQDVAPASQCTGDNSGS